MSEEETEIKEKFKLFGEYRANGGSEDIDPTNLDITALKVIVGNQIKLNAAIRNASPKPQAPPRIEGVNMSKENAAAIQSDLGKYQELYIDIDPRIAYDERFKRDNNLGHFDSVDSNDSVILRDNEGRCT